jgi:hypothetical protein
LGLQAMFGKSRGLKPMMTYWKYIIMLRPIVVYAALMWWPRIKKKVCVNEFTQLQRTACIDITGAFRTTPTAALEVAIGLTPLPLRIEGEARASYFRICRFGKAIQRGNIAHSNFSWDTVLENMFNMRTDTVIPRYSFAKKFTVTYPDRSEWKILNKVSVRDLSGIQTDPKLALALEEIYLEVKPDWFLVWVPSPLSSRQRYLP